MKQPIAVLAVLCCGFALPALTAAAASFYPLPYDNSFFLYPSQPGCDDDSDKNHYEYLPDGFCICNCYRYSDPKGSSFNETYPVYNNNNKPQCSWGSAVLPAPVGQCKCQCQNLNYASALPAAAPGVQYGPDDACAGDS